MTEAGSKKPASFKEEMQKYPLDSSGCKNEKRRISRFIWLLYRVWLRQ